MVFGNCGVLHCPSLESKGYVEMTSVDADTSHDIVEAIGGKGGRYLEAQVRSKRPSLNYSCISASDIVPGVLTVLYPEMGLAHHVLPF